jgi:hypothetical protein
LLPKGSNLLEVHCHPVSCLSLANSAHKLLAEKGMWIWL